MSNRGHILPRRGECSDREWILHRIAEEDRGFSTPCWIWQMALNSNGYGRTVIGNRCKIAHRFAYEVFKGDIPEGFAVDHLCRVRRCVRPDHLEAVTTAENNRRNWAVHGDAMIAMRRRHFCPSGHEKTGTNLVIVGNSEFCRECKRDRNKRRYASAPSRSAA